MSSEAPTQSSLSLAEHLPLPVELHPNIDHLVTEDNAPVDNQFAEKQHRLLAETLYNSWQPGDSFVAMSNVGLFYSLHTPPFVPDLLVSLGVSSPANPFPKRYRSYFVWEYGKVPDLVVEVVSNTEGGEDTTKLKGYAKIGITYYVIYDPEKYLSSSPLRIYRLAGGRFELERTESPIFESLGLGMRIWDGEYETMHQSWLRWTTLDGKLLPTGKEESLRAEDEKQRAEHEKQRAEHEKQRADIAEQEAKELRDRLKQLGLDS
jgi:Uma2 family endonuclease